MTHALILRSIVETLPRFSYNFASETVLHEGIAKVLTEAGIGFEREFVAGPKDRFDFLVPPGVVIEAKVQGSMSEPLSQVSRYAQRDDVSAVVLVTTRFWGRMKVPDKLHGKPFRLLQIRRASF